MPGTVAELSALGLKERLGSGGPMTVLDVREDHERAHAAIPLPGGVVDLHVPLGEVARRFEEIEAVSKEGPLVIYCHHGQRSMVAATWLANRGLGEVINLEGGIDAWSRRVDASIRRY